MTVEQSTVNTGFVVSPRFDVLFLQPIEPGDPIFSSLGHSYTNTGTIEALCITEMSSRPAISSGRWLRKMHFVSCEQQAMIEE